MIRKGANLFLGVGQIYGFTRCVHRLKPIFFLVRLIFQYWLTLMRAVYDVAIEFNDTFQIILPVNASIGLLILQIFIYNCLT